MPVALGMLIVVVVAVLALFSQAPSSQPRPLDDPPYDFASSGEQAHFSADPSKE
jgi:hypothetical protein